MISISNTLIDIAPTALGSEVVESTQNFSKTVIKEPIGTVFLLSPYNYPLISVMTFLVPAVLSGNPVIIKPSPYSPLTGQRIAKAFADSGVPFLVQDLLLETKHISKFLSSPQIAYVNLVGNVNTGRALYKEIASESFTDIGLFLTSSNGVYIAEDAEINSSVSNIIRIGMENSGQSNYKFGRVFVHKSLFKEFLGLAEPLIRSYSVGDPMDETTTLGPITEPDNIDQLIKNVEEVVASNGSIVCGGNPCNDDEGKGRFFEPTIMTDVDDSLSIMVYYI